jgi:hypothetical protein
MDIPSGKVLPGGVIIQPSEGTCLRCKFSQLLPKEAGGPPGARLCFGLPPSVHVHPLTMPNGQVSMQNTAARPIVMPQDQGCSLHKPRIDIATGDV